MKIQTAAWTAAFLILAAIAATYEIMQHASVVQQNQFLAILASVFTPVIGTLITLVFVDKAKAISDQNQQGIKEVKVLVNGQMTALRQELSDAKLRIETLTADASAASAILNHKVEKADASKVRRDLKKIADAIPDKPASRPRATTRKK